MQPSPLFAENSKHPPAPRQQLAAKKNGRPRWEGPPVEVGAGCGLLQASPHPLPLHFKFAFHPLPLFGHFRR